MDSILTEFIQRTKADPALAQDLLEATEWNLDMAETAYNSLQETRAVEPQEYVYDPKDFDSIRTIPEATTEDYDMLDSDPAQMGNPNVDVNEANRRAILKRKKHKRSRGLSFQEADEVIDKFNKVAVVKQRVSTKEQIIIDDKFFNHSFVYPDLSSEEVELQEYIAKDLLEISHKRALERSGRLNWWTSTGRLPRLEPLATSGDGNCLLHAASLYMWGLHDHSLILRTALHRLLTLDVEREGIKRRWKYQTQLRNDEAGGLTFTEEEWDFEWGEILRIATNQPRRQPMTASLRRHSSLRMSYESLEEVHIFALAHTLRRPVVVLSDRTIKDLSGQDLAPIYFGGIYLPLEVNPTACYKSPVVLAYDSSHFSPLVAVQEVGKSGKQQPRGAKYARMSSRVETVIPLVTSDGSLLPVQFVYDPKKKDVQEKWSRMDYGVGEFPDDIIRLLESHMNVRWIQLNVASSDVRVSEDYDHVFPVQVPKVRFPAAAIVQEAQPIYQKDLVDRYLTHIQARFREDKEARARREAEREEEERKRLENMIVACEGDGCDMFGRPATNNLCSVCYQKLLLSVADESPSPPGCSDGEPDVADLHRPKPSQRVRGSPDPPAGGADSQREEPGRSGGGFVGESSPSRSAVVATNPPSNPDEAKATKKILAPLQSAPNTAAWSQRGPSPQHNPKLPLLPPKVSRASLAEAGGRTPDENTPKSRSTSPPPTKTSPLRSKSPPRPSHPSKGSSSTPKAAPPTSPVKPKGASPSPSKAAPPPPASWVNLVPRGFKKTSPPHRGYSRDNILPLHLDSGGVTLTGANKKCQAISCESFSSPDSEGYCSQCYKVLKDNVTVV